MKYIESDGKPHKKRTAHYRFFQALYMAFFSRELYVDIAKRWRGVGFGYLFFLLSILVLPCAVQVMLEFKDNVDENMMLPMKQLPPFEIREGEVFFHGKMPYLVKNKQDNVISIIDTNGSIKALPSMLYPDAKVLVTRHAIHMMMLESDPLQGKMGHAQTEHIYPVTGEDDTLFSGAAFIEKVQPKLGSYLLMASFYPMGVMLFVSIYGLVLFALVFVGQVLARIVYKVPLSFKETARILVVSATPQAFLYFGLLAFDKANPSMALMYVVLLSVYFSFGVLSCRSASKALVAQ